MRRGEIWWASLGRPAGSGPGYRRPVLILQSNDFNESKIQTVVIAALTSNLKLAAAPGNVLCRKKQTRLSRDLVINVSQILTIDKRFLTNRISVLSSVLLREVDAGLRLVLSL
ncbi:MAG TPA: type II toxin-antitoxin system PemK/MazF family toxin [Acidobacteriota bacterium]|nr:type II toxin-antitoxin system PemK/MazF family toxin [Acidobacteriota bacterium]